MDRAAGVAAASAARLVLGPDALGRILSYLPVADHLAAAAVCTEWRDVVFSRQHAARSLGLPVRDEAAVRAAAESAQLPAHLLAALHAPAPAAGWHEEFFESQHLWKLPGSDGTVFFVGAPGGNRAVVGQQHFPRVAPLRRCCMAARRRNVSLAERRQCAAELGTARRRGQVFVPWAGVVYAAGAAERSADNVAAAAAAGSPSGLTTAAAAAAGPSAAAAGASALASSAAAPSPAAPGVPVPAGIPIIGAQLVQYYEVTIGPAPVFADPSKGKAGSSAGAASAGVAGGAGQPPTEPPVGFDVSKYTENQKLWTRAGAVAAGFRFAPAPCVAVGVCTKRFPLSRRMPGWCHNSFAYHGDDGSKFHGSGSGSEYGDVFGPGDTIGCGIVYWGESTMGPQKKAPQSAAASAAPATARSLLTGTGVRTGRSGAAAAAVGTAASPASVAPAATTTSPDSASDPFDLRSAPATPFIFFTRNGVYLGPAFASVDVSRAWYPAVGIDAPFTITPNFGGLTASGVVRPFLFDLPRFNHAVWSHAVVPPPPLITSVRQLQLPAVVIPAATAGAGGSGVDASVDSDAAGDSYDDELQTSSGGEDDDSGADGARSSRARPAKRARRSIGSDDELDEEKEAADARADADSAADAMVITMAPPPVSVLSASRPGAARTAKAPAAAAGPGPGAVSTGGDHGLHSESCHADGPVPAGERFAAAGCACASSAVGGSFDASAATHSAAVAPATSHCAASTVVLTALARRSAFARFCKLVEATADVAAAAVAPAAVAPTAGNGTGLARHRRSESDSKTVDDALHSDSKDSEDDDDDDHHPRARAVAGGLSMAPKPPATRGAAAGYRAAGGDAVSGRTESGSATSGMKRRRPASTGAASDEGAASSASARPPPTSLRSSAGTEQPSARPRSAVSASASAAGAGVARSSQPAATSARRGEADDEPSSDEDEKGWALRVEPSRAILSGGDDEVLLPEGSERQRAAHLALIDFYRLLVMEHPDGLMHGLDALDDDFDPEDGDSEVDASDAWDDEEDDDDEEEEGDDDASDDGEGPPALAGAAAEAPAPPDAADGGGSDDDDVGGDADV